MDSSLISQPRLKDNGYHVTYDDESDTYVTYRPDWSYPLAFQGDKGGVEFYVAPAVTEEEYDNVIHDGHIYIYI